MDLNNYDFSSYDDDDYPTPQNNPNYNPSFTQLLSNNSDFQNVDVFGNPMSLSQFSTQNMVVNTPISCTKKSQKASTSKKKQCNPKKNNDNRKWSEKEDEALMSDWCMCSTDSIVGKNQNNITRWNNVFDLYEQSRVENQNQTQLSIRSVDAMKSRFKRLNFLVNKWVGCYKQILNRPPASGTNIDDDIDAAQKLFCNANDGNEFVDFNVYNNVMSKHQKWSLQNNDFGVTREVSGSSSKRSRYEFESTPSSINVSTPSSVNGDEDINNRPEGREAAKKRKSKAKVSDSMFSEDDLSRLDGHRLNTEAQIEQRQRRIEADLKIEELRLLKTKTKMEMMMLNTLLAKQHLSPKDDKILTVLAQKYMPDV